MRKLLLILTMLLVSPIWSVWADPSIYWNFGSLNLTIPFSEVDAVYLWDFVGKRSLLGGETPLASIKALTVTAGGVTSTDGLGAPYAGFYLALPNPAPNLAALNSIHPGIWGGYDFRESGWMGGLKASVNIF